MSPDTIMAIARAIALVMLCATIAVLPIIVVIGIGRSK